MMVTFYVAYLWVHLLAIQGLISRGGASSSCFEPLTSNLSIKKIKVECIKESFIAYIMPSQ